ncbi:MAG: VWA domain-containing protein, partial [Spirochaetales bacterium]|nr:VWA domain-containing protein [Spirochaetales bacterium]
MQSRFFVVVFTFLAITLPCFGAGESEGSSSDRSEYLAGKGIIVPPKDILPESFIAQIDYNYPDPHPLPVGLTVRTGNRQIGSDSKKELIHIGLKAYKVSFDQLPPLNLVYVIDISGSMYDANKIDWVKEALEIFLSKVREKDYVALVVFNENARVIFESAKMDKEQKRTEFKNAVKALSTSGGSNILAGMTLGYKQVQINFDTGYSNRVILMTDGLAERKDIMEMADTYKKRGINCSTVGMGVSFNSELMVELAKAGGGSSRFIPNRREMTKIFSHELDRMVVSAARDLTIDLRLRNGATLLNTWG